MGKFFKTVITVTVLSEDKPAQSVNLTRIAHEILEGEWSGYTENDGGTELTAKEAAEALIAQGSDPEFFRLDDDGNHIDYDGNPIDEKCSRCGSAIDGDGYCGDATCPYSDHKQDETWTEA